MNKKEIRQKNAALFKRYFTSKKLAFKIVSEHRNYYVISLCGHEIKLYSGAFGLIDENSLLVLKSYAQLVYNDVMPRPTDPLYSYLISRLFIAEFAEVPLTKEIYLRIDELNNDGVRKPYLALKGATRRIDSITYYYRPYGDNEAMLETIRQTTEVVNNLFNFDEKFIRDNYGAFAFFVENMKYANRVILAGKIAYGRGRSSSIYKYRQELSCSRFAFVVEDVPVRKTKDDEDEEDVSKVTFDDVYCLDDIVTQFREIGTIITNYKEFTSKGVRIPYGVMLVGEPGTGKTLTVNAFINEYKLNRYDIMQSELSNYNEDVSEVFDKARRNKPAVIVIDEIDKMKLDSSFYQEMSGQVSNSGILVIATANSLSGIHPSLLRPGRFDRKILYRVLSGETKKKMLQIKLEKTKVPYSIDFDTIVELMPDASNAHIDTYVNEALLQSTLHHENVLSDECLLEAIQLVDNGYVIPRKYNNVTKQQIRIHEAGHALVALHYLGPDSIVKIDTNPGFSYGGYVQLTKDEGTINDDTSLKKQIKIGLGGIIAERLFTDSISVGASNDLSRVRRLCEDMIVHYGLVDIASITAAMFYINGQVGTENAKNSVIEQSRLIIEEAEHEVTELLNHYSDVLFKLVALLEAKPVLLKKDIVTFWDEEVTFKLN